MRRVALIYNPFSGQTSARRSGQVSEALAVLRQAGVEVEALETTDAPGSARAYAEQAVERGCDTILACGGDGTVHEVLQSLVGTRVALGIVPLGTANALAANLGLHGSPARAVRMLLKSTPVEVPVGLIAYRGLERGRVLALLHGCGRSGRGRAADVAAGCRAEAPFRVRTLSR